MCPNSSLAHSLKLYQKNEHRFSERSVLMMVVMVVGVLPHILLKNPASLYKVHTDTTPHLLRLFVTVNQSSFVFYSHLLCVFVCLALSKSSQLKCFS